MLRTLIFTAIFFQTGFAQNPVDDIAGKIEQKSFDPATLSWYASPATNWIEALPVGNGRLGAMVFGNYGEERIQLNEETYWSGGPYSTVVKSGYKVLPLIQELVFQEKYLEAHNLFGRRLMGYPVEQQKYQSLANLHLFFAGQDTVENYKRWLDLETGVAGVQYSAQNITYRREVFASAPDGVIVIRLTADQPQALSLTVNLRGVRNQAHSNYGTDYFQMDPFGQDGLILTGRSTDYLGIPGKLKYVARVQARIESGTMQTAGVDLIIDKATAVTLYFAAATNFVNYKKVNGDAPGRVEQYLAGLQHKTYAQIYQTAVQDHHQYFSRVKLSLPIRASSYLPVPERIKSIQNQPDPALSALSYNFGRYLLIASSRPGTQPANLQGIWNDEMNPAWDSKYTTNINTQMNYWPAESSNLSECALPLFDMIKELTDQGTQVAREHYGARGWVFHQNTDLWRVAAPMDGPTWGTFTVGGAWLCTHLWEHFAYTQDQEFLQEAYPLIKGSVKFFMDFLVPHPRQNWLVTNPSTSPENFPDGGGNKPYFDEVTAGFRPGTTICAGSSIDMQILYDLFGYFIEASAVLGKKEPWIDQVKRAREQLVPPQIGSDGALQEWADDWRSLEKNHRHFSHLYGLYPGRILSEKRTAELMAACKKVLEERGDGATGWSRAWKMALWARLGDGNRANKIYKGYINEQSCTSLFSLCGREPQVDGTFGTTAAITEMLMQSHDGYIKLLPALPDDWASGAYSGVVARGAFVLDFDWQDKQITRLIITARTGGPCRLDYRPGLTIKCNGQPVAYRQVTAGQVEFKTVKGEKYEIE